MPAFALFMILWLALDATACRDPFFSRSPRQVHDDQVAGAVKNALLDSRRLNLSRIDVSVEDGICYLSGEASSGESKVEAERIARQTPGVERVINKLEVQP